MEFTHMLGIDVSKKTIDVALSLNAANATITNQQFSNTLKGFKDMLLWLKQQKVKSKAVLFCMENTGIYHRYLVLFLQKAELFTWVETPVQIKWSLGLQRGKNDKIDARRICLYAYRNQDKAVNYKVTEPSLQKVADLLAARQRLIAARKMLQVPIKELQQMGLKQEAKLVEKACAKSIAALEKEIDDIEVLLEELIAVDESLSNTYKHVRSVRCVGLVAALQLMVYTNNFTRFDCAKQLASYSGVAPFEYSSGTSVKGKTKVHNMANKTLKTTLHMCAVSSVRHNPEMKKYMERKVAEGKNKMSILNAIRNKIIQRVFACVRDQRMYEYKETA